MATVQTLYLLDVLAAEPSGAEHSDREHHRYHLQSTPEEHPGHVAYSQLCLLHLFLE